MTSIISSLRWFFICLIFITSAWMSPDYRSGITCVLGIIWVFTVEWFFEWITVQPLKVTRLTQDAIIPTRGSPECAGFDLYSTVSVIIPGALAPLDKMIHHVQFCEASTSNETLQAPGRYAIRTGLAVQIPKGYYGRIAARSSCAMRGLDVSAGVIDSDYRGEIKVLLVNWTHHPVTIQKGERIAQLIIEKIANPPITECLSVQSLSSTVRGTGGFGSTN